MDKGYGGVYAGEAMTTQPGSEARCPTCGSHRRNLRERVSEGSNELDIFQRSYNGPCRNKWHAEPTPAAPASPTPPDDVKKLTDSIDWVETNHPLPRCGHGKALKDGGGELLEPSCGCRFAPSASTESPTAQLLPRKQEWSDCDGHVWVEEELYRCKKCGCPGRGELDGGIDWPDHTRVAAEPAPRPPVDQGKPGYFATGYTKEDLRAMHPTVELKLQNGEDVVIDARFSHYGVGTGGEKTAYLFVGSETVVFPAKYVREKRP